MANPKSLSKRTTLRLNHRAIVTGLIILVYVVACCCPALRFASIAAAFAGAWILFLAPRTEPQMETKKTP